MSTLVYTSNGDFIKSKIIKVLEKNTNGVTTTELSHNVGAHRHTVTKYVLELSGSKIIVRRKIGPAVLHYLKKNCNGGLT